MFYSIYNVCKIFLKNYMKENIKLLLCECIIFLYNFEIVTLYDVYWYSSPNLLSKSERKLEFAKKVQDKIRKRLKMTYRKNDKYNSKIIHNLISKLHECSHAITSCLFLWQFTATDRSIETSCIHLMYEPRRETTCSLSGSNWLRFGVELDRIGLLIIPARCKNCGRRKGNAFVL